MDLSKEQGTHVFTRSVLDGSTQNTGKYAWWSELTAIRRYRYAKKRLFQRLKE